MSAAQRGLEFGEGERVARILGGEPPFERGSRFEPSLLPHVARLCHDFSIVDVLQAADLFGRNRGHPLHWPQIWESTFATLLSRFGPDQLTGAGLEALDLEIETYRALAGAPIDVADLRSRIATGGGWHTGRLLGRLVSIDPAPVDALIDTVDPRDLDAEASRRVLVAASRSDVRPPTDWFEQAAGLGNGWVDGGRAAHVLTAVPPGDERRELVDRIVAGVDWGPSWYVALLASRLAGELTSAARSQLREMVADPDWALLVDSFTEPARDLDADLRRAHLFATDLDAIDGPHESTAESPMQMIHEWGGAPPAAAAPGDLATVDAPPPPPPPAAPPPPPAREPGAAAPLPRLEPPSRSAGPPPVVGEPLPAAPAPESEPPAERAPGGLFGRLRERFGRGRSAGPAEETGAEPPAVAERDDRRLGIDAWLGGHQLTRGLVRDTATDIEVSIGPPGSAETQTGGAIAIDFTDVARRVLPVRFIVGGEADRWKQMTVRQDPSSRASVTFGVIPTGDTFNALVVVYEEDRATVVEAASFAADVAADQAAADAAAPQRLVKVPAAGVAAPSNDRVGSVISDDRHVATSTAVRSVQLPQSTDGALQPVLAAMRTTASNFVARPDATDISSALVAAATFGFQLRRSVGLDPLADVDRIQVVSLSGDDVFPLELVYDGDPPLDGAPICDAWTRPTASGGCPRCTDPTDRSVVCPLRFWGLRKRIEHYTAAADDERPHATPQRFESGSVVASSSAVVGASEKVLQVLAASRAAAATTASTTTPDLADLLAELVSHLAADRSSIAEGWRDWCNQIGQHHPGLLIAMPHQEGDQRSLPSLELGGEFERVLLEQHVRAAGDEPGPVVLLLGCDTSTAPNRIASFASEARFYAPVVVATLGKVIAEEAPHVAAVLVDRLDDARSAGATICDAVIEARRTLLAESRLVGLQLVAHGDARWQAG